MKPMDLKTSGLKGAEATKKRYSDAIVLAREGIDTLITEDPELATRFYATYKRMRLETGPAALDLPDEATCYWFHGPTRTGKSFLARRLYEDIGYYVKPAATKWWDGYAGERVVIMDDFDLHHAYQGHNLKIWCDRYKFFGEFKGGVSRYLRPSIIVVTSNYTIASIWGSESQTREPLQARFEEYEVDSRQVANNLFYQLKI